MFWRVASGSVSSEPELLLSKEDITLDEILDAPYIVQEVNTSNKDAVKLLTRDDVLDSLVEKIINPPSTDEDTDESAETRLVACEIICSECVAIADALFNRQSCIFKIFRGFGPALEGHLDIVRSIARIVAHLLTHNPHKLMRILQANVSLLENLVPLAGNLDVAETLTRLLGADDEGPTALKAAHLQWLRATFLLDKLIDQMEAEESLQSEYAAEILAAIARARICPLTQDLASGANLSRILKYAGSKSQSAKFIRALNICISLVERRRVWDEASRNRALSSQDPNSSNLPEMPDPDAEIQLELRAVKVIAPKAVEFMTQLGEEQSQKQQETPYGSLKPPLGSGRLTVMALISVLLRTGLPVAENTLMDSGLLAKCLSLMREYPFNSILHQQVTVILAGVLELGSNEVVDHVFRECKLLEWLIELPTEVSADSGTTVLPARAGQTLQAGYTGHITQIANRILHAGAMRQEVHDYVMQSPGWHSFVREHVQAANERQDVGSWECGRPKVALDSVESVGHDLMDDELAANMEYRGSKAFGLAMKSAFSSGDSDDDEEDISNNADALFEDVEALDGELEAGTDSPPGPPTSRFKIRQILPSFVDDWEDLADDESNKAVDNKLTPRPDGNQRVLPPASPFSGSVKTHRRSSSEVTEEVIDAVERAEVVDTGTSPSESRLPSFLAQNQDGKADTGANALKRVHSPSYSAGIESIKNASMEGDESKARTQERRRSGDGNDTPSDSVSGRTQRLAATISASSLPPLSVPGVGPIAAPSSSPPSVIGPGFLKEALQASIHIDRSSLDRTLSSDVQSPFADSAAADFQNTGSPVTSQAPGANSAAHGDDSFGKPISPNAEDRKPAGKVRKSDTDSKLEKMKKDNSFDMLEEIKASLGELQGELDIGRKDGNSVGIDARQQQPNGAALSHSRSEQANEKESTKPGVPNGTGPNVIATSREEDLAVGGPTSPNSWLNAEKLRDVRKSNNAAILLP